MQDLFSSGAIKSATDFQVYKEIGNLSGLDFAYTDNGAVYHTKVFSSFFWFLLDKISLLLIIVYILRRDKTLSLLRR